MAKPYQEGAGWAFRMRIRGEAIYRSGFRNKTEAMRWTTATCSAG